MKTTQVKIYGGQIVFHSEIPVKHIHVLSGQITVEFNYVEHCDK